MRYPKPLQPGDLIGITGPSGGVRSILHPRLEAAKRALTSRGYRLREGACLRDEVKHVSAEKTARARDFAALWLDPEVAAIIPPWGGELLIEILPLLDFAKLAAAPPRWVMGYSDTSTLLLPLTLLTDVVTAHGTCLMEMVTGQVDALVTGCLAPLAMRPGTRNVQESSERFQTAFTDFAHEPERGFELTEPTRWKVLGADPDATVAIEGRLIGGCLDTLVSLVGTRFGDVPTFVRRQARDGVIVYLENCELEPCAVARALWTIRLAGWLDGVRGLLLGRSAGKDATQSDRLSYAEALQSALGDLAMPVIYDADVGHQPPQMTLLNGARARVTCARGRGQVVQWREDEDR